MVLALVCSCEQETTLTVDQTAISFGIDGGQQTIKILTNKAWNCTSGQSWCKVSPSSGSGDGSITISCEANSDYDDRSCTITINAAELSKSITVTQSKKGGLVISKNDYSISSAAQQISVDIQANVNYSYTVEGDASEWIKSSSTKGLSSSTVKFDIEENKSFESREGKITFKQSDGNLTGTVTVKQDGFNGILISTPEYAVSNEEHLITVQVEANVDYEAVSECDWIEIVSTKAVTKSELTLKVAANETYDKREGKVSINQKDGDISQTITVSQAESFGLKVSKDDFTLNSDAQTIEIEVLYNVNYDVIIPTEAQSWISEANTKGLTSKIHTFRISENTEAERGTEITFKQKDGALCATVSVKQNSAAPSYEIINYTVIDNLNRYASQVADIKKLPASQQSMVGIYLSSAFPKGSEKMRKYTIEYPSIDPDGNAVTLSAVVMIPDKAFTDKRKIDGTIIASHYTISSDAECPSRAFVAEGILSWTNHILILPDYYGFGSSVDKFQAYLNETVAAKTNIDAINAVKQLVEDNNLDVAERMINFGYSQGGYNALATLKYVTEHPETDIVFQKTFAGGGPYDPYTVFKNFIKAENTPQITLGLVALFLISYVENENIGVSYSDLFKEPLLSHVDEWYLSSQYSTLDIAECFGTLNINDIFTENLTSMSGPIFEKLCEVAKSNSLITNWKPSNGESLYIYHSETDDFVSYENFTLLKAMFDANPGNYTANYVTSTGGHQECFLDFVMTTVLKNW